MIANTGLVGAEANHGGGGGGANHGGGGGWGHPLDRSRTKQQSNPVLYRSILLWRRQV